MSINRFKTKQNTDLKGWSGKVTVVAAEVSSKKTVKKQAVDFTVLPPELQAKYAKQA